MILIHIGLKMENLLELSGTLRVIGTCGLITKIDASGAAPNNGMHPTADTTALIYFQRPGAAGDAGRYASVE